MDRLKRYFDEFNQVVARHRKVTIVTHINPDADTIGTGLGLYGYLKNSNKQVEIVNASGDFPIYLDFLKHFTKIKKKIDYDDSLIIACDCGSLDRLGFDMSGREIVNIDHHASNSRFGILNIVDSDAVSSSEVVFRMLQGEKLDVDIATALYVALVSDTQKFSTDSVSEDTFELASKMISLGVDLKEVNANMNQRKSLASIRILGRALQGLELRHDGKIAIIRIDHQDIKATGATMKNIDGVVDYAISLATVQVAILLVERDNGAKVSMRSKRVDVSQVAKSYGGGGHKRAAGFEISDIGIADLSNKLIEKILTKEEFYEI